jgi:hypothetical protein
VLGNLKQLFPAQFPIFRVYVRTTTAIGLKNVGNILLRCDEGFRLGEQIIQVPAYFNAG